MLRHIVPSRESRPLTPPPEALLFEKLFQILLRGGDGINAEILYKVVQHIGRNKRRQRGAKANSIDYNHVVVISKEGFSDITHPDSFLSGIP